MRFTWKNVWFTTCTPVWCKNIWNSRWRFSSVEEEERQHKEAEETAKAANTTQAEQANPSQKQPSEAPKETAKMSSDIQIVVTKENGTGQEVEVDVNDVPPGTGQRASVTDLARYMAEN